MQPGKDEAAGGLVDCLRTFSTSCESREGTVLSDRITG